MHGLALHNLGSNGQKKSQAAFLYAHHFARRRPGEGVQTDARWRKVESSRALVFSAAIGAQARVYVLPPAQLAHSSDLFKAAAPPLDHILKSIFPCWRRHMGYGSGYAFGSARRIKATNFMAVRIKKVAQVHGTHITFTSTRRLFHTRASAGDCDIMKLLNLLWRVASETDG